MAKDKSKKIISTGKGDSSKKSSTKKIVETSGNKSKKISAKSKEPSRREQIDSIMKSKKAAATQSTRSSRNTASLDRQVLFGRSNYILIGAGIATIFLGMLLMGGGEMPDANTWDESLIYSTRRTLIAPIVILIGLGIGVFAIFRD